mmetsp:Transcript_4922/g.8529  ORF Transcript_4922/g.8529 Transcript_4922/m.8529 type:complete len:221 (+) Transcript_4922:88-750(+)
MFSANFDRVFIVATLLFAGVCTADFGADADGELTEAHLIARKNVKETMSVSGENMTVVTQIFNAGSSAALDVDLKETTFPSTYYDLIEGSFTATWEKIGAGANVSHTFVVRPKSSGTMLSGPAVVTYRPTGDSDEIQTMLTTSINRPVLSIADKYMSLALKFGKYVTLGFLKTQADWTMFGGLGASLFLLFGVNSSILKYKCWRRERMSKSATEDLMKED